MFDILFELCRSTNRQFHANKSFRKASIEQTKTALEFLSEFPTFEATQGRTDEKFNEFLDKNRCFHPQARQRFFDAIKLKPIEVDDAVVKAKSLFVTTIVEQLKTVVASLKEYQKQIETLYNKFDDEDYLRSLPLVDVILAPKLLVSIGIDRERFSLLTNYKVFLAQRRILKSLGNIAVFISASLVKCELL